MTRHHRVFAVALGALAPWPAHAAEGGLTIMPDPARLVALLVLFVALVPLLNALLFRPLLEVLEDRERRIEGARTRATELATQAGSLLELHAAAVREVREAANAERRKAVEEARAAHQSAVAEARRLAEREVTATRSEVGAALEAARASLRADAESLAREVAERLLQRRLA
jgi:F-type H+-transporting ATPase subunit b